MCIQGKQEGITRVDRNLGALIYYQLVIMCSCGGCSSSDLNVHQVCRGMV
jgi:hypothetical protein